jgi:FkbH-like protein
VTTHLLSPDPSNYVFELQNTRLFEITTVTREDEMRTEQYQAIHESKAQSSASGSMAEYLQSLHMEATVSPFVTEDVPRITQLINKSNQFNLTTRRRNEAEVISLLDSPNYVTLTIRLKDRFVDHGLISILIGEISGESIVIDTWLMSCRVLQRQVENLALNALVIAARQNRCSRIEGIYIPTTKNILVFNHYPKLGFELARETSTLKEYTLELLNYEPTKTYIAFKQRDV